jgi:hypothetical protein
MARNDTLGRESRDSFRFWLSVAFDGAPLRRSERSVECLHSSKAEQSPFSFASWRSGLASAGSLDGGGEDCQDTVDVGVGVGAA